VLTVGAADFSPRYAIPLDFPTIGQAMDFISLVDPDSSNRAEQWTILVMPGYYREVIQFKPFVNVVGLLKEAVIVASPDDITDDDRLRVHSTLLPPPAQVYLCSNSLLSNVTVAVRGDSSPGHFAVRGYDVNIYPGNRRPRGDVHFLGLANVDFHTYPPYPKSGPPAGGGLIKFDGNWRTVIFRDVGGNYDAPRGFGIELTGREPFQNADCHFINCFFDALFLSGEGGVIQVADCYEVHLRNSLVRVRYKEGALIEAWQPPPITAVKTMRTRGAKGPIAPNVHIQGSTLYGPGTSVLDVGENTVCFFRHSFSDSMTCDGKFFASASNGIGNL
jgi:hypothetical protein